MYFVDRGLLLGQVQHVFLTSDIFTLMNVGRSSFCFRDEPAVAHQGGGGGAFVLSSSSMTYVFHYGLDICLSPWSLRLLRQFDLPCYLEYIDSRSTSFREKVSIAVCMRYQNMFVLGTLLLWQWLFFV